MNESELLKTALHRHHISAEAKMGEEGGWEVPLSYGGAVDEVGQVRNRAGVFDISHLGRIRIRGDGALGMLERLCTADVAHQEDDTALYTLLCNETGGILDDGWLVRAENFWLLTTNSCNRHKILEHIQRHAADFDVKIDDQTERTAHLFVTGPQAKDVLDAVLPQSPSALPRGGVKIGSLVIARYVAMRIGYCNEWSIEVIIPNMVAGQAWSFITRKAGSNSIDPVGLTARDVLRIESALPRYGHELNETIDPITAGLERAVDFGHQFIGADALGKLRERGPSRKRIGLVLTSKGKPEEASIPKQGSVARRSDQTEIGTVTSGTFSPTLNRVIAIGYVTPDGAEVGDELLVEIDSEKHTAQAVELPFYTPGETSC